MTAPKRDWREAAAPYMLNCNECGRIIVPHERHFADQVTGHLVRHEKCHEVAEAKFAGEIDLRKLSAALGFARQAGSLAAANTPDHGSMSRDYVSIPVGKSFPIKRRSKRVQEALGGESVIVRESGVWRGYLLEPPGVGRASARLAACEAMAKALSQYVARVYYRRD